MRAWSAALGAALLLSMPLPAQAAPTADDARAQLRALYVRAAMSAQAFDAAQGRVAASEAAVRRERAAAQRAQGRLAEQSAAVATLTIQQLQGQSGIERYATMLSGAGPRAYLERAAAYDSAAEAMTARIDELAASRVVHAAQRQRLQAALERQQHAVRREASARDAINAAIAESKRQTRLAAESFERAHPERPSAPPAAPTPPTSTPPTLAAPPTLAEEEPSPPPPPQPTPPIGPPQPELGSSEPFGEWDRIARCESGGNWHINTGNGYYGGLQFSYRTWQSVGGPGYPHEQSREVQIHYARILQQRSGWGQWSCAWARFG